MRAYLSTLGLLAAGGVLGLVAAAQSWGSATAPSSFTTTAVTVSGGDLAPLARAMPLVGLAAVILVPAVRGIGRRIVGAVLVLLGAATSVVVLMIGADLTSRVRRWVESGPDHTGSVQDVSTSAVWVYTAAFAALLVLVAGAAVAVRGPGWPSMGARYERPDRRGGGRGTGSERGERPVGGARTGDDGPAASAAEVWDALDRGDDPTADGLTAEAPTADGSAMDDPTVDDPTA